MCALWWYIHQVKNVPLPNPDMPGPFDGTGLPLLCRGTQFPNNGAGPLKIYHELIIWFDYQLYSHQVRLYRAWGLLWKSPKFPQPVGSGNPLVFCHNELNMRNIMLDDNNRVWLLDWEYSGAYPPWFDYAVLQGRANAVNHDRRLPRLFRLFIPIIAGNHSLIYHHYWKRFSDLLHDVKKPGYFEELGIDTSV
ncbi:hypothetical protein BDP27DRAFT_1319400 [Rhodocollybia butyracea]|uniref:Aminoglycoside phosphotransferase domain-containing protein n=1 Tax=Rhodocollybia butyracea TaxID=206335 RepID=A0A9P5Q2X0_9AGAR|nr:hypothetical protein BDP27DRAFT_1319400 [Rhodocollybia butyracea]